MGVHGVGGSPGAGKVPGNDPWDQANLNNLKNTINNFEHDLKEYLQTGDKSYLKEALKLRGEIGKMLQNLNSVFPHNPKLKAAAKAAQDLFNQMEQDSSKISGGDIGKVLEKEQSMMQNLMHDLKS